MRIHSMGSGVATRFAAKELRRYLRLLIGAERGEAKAGGTVRLGTFAQMGLPATSESEFDDEVVVEMGPEGGIIAGANDRSVLLGTYRYLTELGCRWVRPGKNGEIIPHLGTTLPQVNLREKPSYRHRGVCIEGAVSWEHVRDMVDWLPKLGFNAYFLQFRDSYNFFQRWYEHELNPRRRSEGMTVEKAADLTRRLRAEISKRGLALHLVGHGWTCEPFGIPGPGWYPHEGPIPEQAVQHLAEVGGERRLHGNIALNTNLCYGNPETRQIITEAIVQYARENPDVDVIHFWLADGVNNHCECPLCRDTRPSDLYVRMLNELDEQLTAAGIGTKIVFLAYVDLLWPPQKERISNPERFLLMFAPITRSYSSSFSAAKVQDAKLPPFRRNRLKFPADPGTNIAFLRAWEAQFPGDGFDFDYHFMWDHYKDPGQFALAKVLHDDVRGLGKIGLNGFMSCQVQRVFFPTGLGMAVLGRTLWDSSLSLDAIATDHLAACYGEGAQDVEAYLKSLSKLFCPSVLRGEGGAEAELAARRAWAKIPAAVDKMQPMVAEGLESPNATQARSWEILGHFGDMARLLSVALVRRSEGAADAEEAAWAVVDWARRTERKLHPVLDVFEFLMTIGGYLGLSQEDLRGEREA